MEHVNSEANHTLDNLASPRMLAKKSFAPVNVTGC